MLRDYVDWYAARLSPAGREAVAQKLARAEADEQLRLLSLLELAVRGMRGLPKPGEWDATAARLYDSPDRRTRRAAESLGAAFGDDVLFARMRKALADSAADRDTRQHALSILAHDSSPANLSHYLKLLDDAALAARIVPLLSRYNDPTIGGALISRLPRWQEAETAAAMEVLSSRVPWAQQTLDAIADGRLKKDQLTAYHARQMASLGDERLNARLAKEWGSFGSSTAELRDEIVKLSAAYQSAPLWAYNVEAGAAHFKKLCAACHEPTPQNANIAPKLAGSGSKGIAYVVENVVDPNAVIGRDYQARMIVTADGRVLSGLVESETASAVTFRTATNTVTIAKDDIDEIRVSENSFMPAGLLQTLNDRERIELFKYLMSQ